MYRCLGIQARLVMSFQPISYKPPTAKQIADKAEKMKEIMDKVIAIKNDLHINYIFYPAKYFR